MIENMTRWLVGSVRFEVIGKEVGRFMTLAGRAGLGLWDMRKEEGVFKASIRKNLYPFLRPIARKCGVRLRHTEKKGLPFQLRKTKKRSGLVVGVFLFAALYYFLSLSVWSIDVSGNEALTKEEVLSAAADLGLSVGTLKSGFYAPQLANELMQALPETGWVSVNTMGNTVTIVLQEKVPKPEIIAKDVPTNVVAGHAGQILRMEVFGGKAVVKVGDAVAEGQLLISGATKDGETGQTSLHHGAGVVTARTRRTLQVEIPEKQMVREETGEVILRCSTRIFGVQLPLTFVGIPQGNYFRETQVSPFVVNEVELPILIYTEKWVGYIDREITIGEAGAKQLAEKELSRLQKELSERATILESGKKQFTYKEGIYTMQRTYLCEEDIAQKIEILIEEP